MLKTITINTKNKIKLDNNIGWALIYRDQFNHDILPDIMPIISAVMDFMINTLQKEKAETAGDFLKNIDVDEIEDALIRLSGLEVTTLINITWAMAKLADDDIPEPLEWVKGYDTFPIDTVAPALFSILAQGMVSTKNLKRLQDTITNLKPKSE